MGMLRVAGTRRGRFLLGPDLRPRRGWPRLRRARAVTAKRLAQDGIGEEKLAAGVDTWWHLTAAELECGVIDETGECVGGKIDWKRKMDGYRRLDAPPSGEPRGLGNRPVRSAATPSVR